jgi:hypothetical protein
VHNCRVPKHHKEAGTLLVKNALATASAVNFFKNPSLVFVISPTHHLRNVQCKDLIPFTFVLTPFTFRTFRVILPR